MRTVRRARASGSLFRYREWPTWWAKYHVHGRAIRESTQTTDRRKAEAFLKARLAQVVAGQPVMPRADRVRFEEAMDDLRLHWETTGSRAWREVRARVAYLGCFFAGWRLAAIKPADVTRYVQQRQGQGAATAINRELATLRRMLRLASEHEKLLRLPVVRLLKQAPPRAGFFEREQYEAARARLADDLQVAVTIAHTYGWRMQSEVLTLERRHVDLAAGTLRLEPGSTKNDEGRVVYLTPEVTALLAAQLRRVDHLGRRSGQIVPFVFPHFEGRWAEQRRRDFRKAWATACKNAGVPGRLRHDFRRTAVRNLERHSVARSVAMKITGHKTESVYRRYAIVSDADLQDATRRLWTLGRDLGREGTATLETRAGTPQNT